ncbi:MAG: class I SAM-dependent methyltransferase [Streptosporangiaceae bacterium]
MSTVNLKGEKATLLATLYSRALDAQSPDSTLRDTMALETVRRLDFDFTQAGVRPGDAAAAALRAGYFDRWARRFLASCPDATVLHLGCGLDTRVFRLDPGPSVRWFDVDYPEVIELRRELYPERAGYQMLGSSVTDPSWLTRVPADRPVLVIAEGLTMYLTEDDGRALFRRIIGHFPSGRFVFDGLSGPGIRLQKFNKAVQAAGATVHWGIEGPGYIEAIDPRLQVVTAVSAFDLEGTERLSTSFRAMAKMSRYVPVLKRLAAFYQVTF